MTELGSAYVRIRPDTTDFDARLAKLRRLLQGIADELGVYLVDDPTPDGSLAASLPSRVVVDAKGAYWRDFGTHFSMCPVSDDNETIAAVAVYTLSDPLPGMRLEDVLAAALALVREGARDVPDGIVVPLDKYKALVEAVTAATTTYTQEAP